MLWTISKPAIFHCFSTLSSGQTAIVASLLKDMIEPAYVRMRGRSLSDRVATLSAKCLSKLHIQEIYLDGIITVLHALKREQ